VREFQQPALLRLVNLGGAPQSAATYQEQASRFTEIAVRAQVDSDVEQAWDGYVASKTLSDRYNGHHLQGRRTFWGSLNSRTNTVVGGCWTTRVLCRITGRRRSMR
jgi:hypothetical protein